MASLVTDGLIHLIGEVQEVSERFKKRSLVLKLDDNGYEQYPEFQMTQDRTAIADNFNKGDYVRVHFNLKGRPYERQDGTTTYFTNLDVWRIENISQDQPNNAQPNYDLDQSQVPPPESSNINIDDIDDALPF